MSSIVIIDDEGGSHSSLRLLLRDLRAYLHVFGGGSPLLADTALKADVGVVESYPNLTNYYCALVAIAGLGAVKPVGRGMGAVLQQIAFVAQCERARRVCAAVAELLLLRCDRAGDQVGSADSRYETLWLPAIRESLMLANDASATLAARLAAKAAQGAAALIGIVGRTVSEGMDARTVPEYWLAVGTFAANSNELLGNDAALRELRSAVTPDDVRDAAALIVDIVSCRVGQKLWFGVTTSKAGSA